MSLESGVILLRLNQELLPEPGRPMARMTAPLGGRGMAGGVGCKVASAGTAGIVGAPVEGADGDAGAAAWLAARAWPFSPPPRPPLVRRRRGRFCAARGTPPWVDRAAIGTSGGSGVSTVSASGSD